MNLTKIQEMFEKEEEYWWFAARREMVLKLLSQYMKPHQSLLDAGCGGGLLTKTVDSLYKVTAIDVDTLSLRLTRSRKPNATVLYANLEKKLPVTPHSFHAVTLLDVLEHVDDQKALSELHRVMRKGGKIFITVPAYPWLFSYWDVLHQHKRRYTRGGLQNLLKEHGFRVVYSSYFNTLFFPLILLLRVIKTIFGIQERSHTDCFEIPPFANSILLKIFRWETQLATRLNIPFGVSLLMIAEKK
jgi:ubiquinone/menaquinone biosynthesis C-methylase UbiE